MMHGEYKLPLALIAGRCCVSASFAVLSAASSDFLASIPGIDGPRDVLRVMNDVDTINAFVSLFWGPLTASVTDSYGRKVMMIVCPAVSALMRAFVARFPSRRAYIFYRIVNAMALSPLLNVVVPAVIGDMHGRSTSAYATASNDLGRCMLVTRLAVTAALGRGGKAQISSRMLYYVAALLSGAASFLFSSLSETLPKDRRRPFHFKKAANPLAFLPFFSIIGKDDKAKAKTKRLWALALVMQSLSCYNTTVDTYRRERYGSAWGVAARARMSMFSELMGLIESYAFPFIFRFWQSVSSSPHEQTRLVSIARWSQRVKSVTSVHSALSPDHRTLFLNILLDALRQGPIALDRAFAGCINDECASQGEIAQALTSLEWPLRLLGPRMFSLAFATSRKSYGGIMQRGTGAFWLAAAIQLCQSEVVLPALAASMQRNDVKKE